MFFKSVILKGEFALRRGDGFEQWGIAAHMPPPAPPVYADRDPQSSVAVSSEKVQNCWVFTPELIEALCANACFPCSFARRCPAYLLVMSLFVLYVFCTFCTL